MARGRRSQSSEDSHRLPEGFVRIGYDADTEVYTFRDSEGTLYKGAPGTEYGTLTPITGKESLSATRPGAFESDKSKKPSGLHVSLEETPKTFHDILPPSCITSTSSSPHSPTSPIRASKLLHSPTITSARVRFIEAARKTALPKMQGVVHSLRRSKTTASSLRHTTSDDTEHLLRRGSTLSRDASQATAIPPKHFR